MCFLKSNCPSRNGAVSEYPYSSIEEVIILLDGVGHDNIWLAVILEIQLQLFREHG
jgi:hypothetical protein